MKYRVHRPLNHMLRLSYSKNPRFFSPIDFEHRKYCAKLRWEFKKKGRNNFHDKIPLTLKEIRIVLKSYAQNPKFNKLNKLSDDILRCKCF